MRDFEARHDRVKMVFGSPLFARYTARALYPLRLQPAIWSIVFFSFFFLLFLQDQARHREKGIHADSVPPPETTFLSPYLYTTLCSSFHSMGGTYRMRIQNVEYMAIFWFFFLEQNTYTPTLYEVVGIGRSLPFSMYR
ncbi:hypothetical protein BDW02DRAFT_335810 [Decorospora gaudefroyi]|uniref:Uncharacterized protein n=1 Tax=Decorospora gaudefroyi TaxID=184978 RepID=A0A6A5K9D0_9PLEO|nr:hypothetical protein BDW02DRAFT_335810 [Decorospora gaudefroyi]